MKKYIAVAKTLFKAQLAYRFDVILTALATVWRVVFAWVLWGAIFAGRDVVGGFTFQEMLSYYVVSSFLASVEISSGVSGEVSNRIRGGTFSKYMVIPANPQIHFMSQSLGASGYYALFSVMAAVLCTVLFGVKISFSTDIVALLYAIVMIPLGLVFMINYQFFIGVLAFKFQDIGFFWHLQGAILEFLTGMVVPLVLVPAPILAALRFLPFTYVTYAPAMLLTGRMGREEGLFGLFTLATWAVAMFLISQYTYNRLRVKFDGVGI